METELTVFGSWGLGWGGGGALNEANPWGVIRLRPKAGPMGFHVKRVRSKL